MACDGRFLALYRITNCRHKSVTPWQNHSTITSLQIGRIHTLQDAASSITRALQGCRRTLCNLPILEAYLLQYIHSMPTPPHATLPVVGKDRSWPTATCPRTSVFRHTGSTPLAPAGRGVNFLICRDIFSSKKAYVVAMHRQVARSHFPRALSPLRPACPPWSALASLLRALPSSFSKT